MQTISKSILMELLITLLIMSLMIFQVQSSRGMVIIAGYTCFQIDSIPIIEMSTLGEGKSS